MDMLVFGRFSQSFRRAEMSPRSSHRCTQVKELRKPAERLAPKATWTIVNERTCRFRPEGRMREVQQCNILSTQSLLWTLFLWQCQLWFVCRWKWPVFPTRIVHCPTFGGVLHHHDVSLMLCIIWLECHLVMRATHFYCWYLRRGDY